MTVQTEGARERLITVGKRLFAEQGLDVVSLREIVRQAGVRHATAVQYHFGDREGLIAAILDEHGSRVSTRREAMLENLEADPDSVDARSVAAALVRPLARELDDTEGRYYLRIYTQWIQRLSESSSERGSSIWHWRRLAEQFLPSGAAPLHPRYSALVFTAVELARRAATSESTDNRLFVSRLIDVVSAIITTPLSEETKRLYSERHPLT